jgi:hypothetical protein
VRVKALAPPADVAVTVTVDVPAGVPVGGAGVVGGADVVGVVGAALDPPPPQLPSAPSTAQTNKTLIACPTRLLRGVANPAASSASAANA